MKRILPKLGTPCDQLGNFLQPPPQHFAIENLWLICYSPPHDKSKKTQRKPQLTNIIPNKIITLVETYQIHAHPTTHHIIGT